MKPLLNADILPQFYHIFYSGCPHTWLTPSDHDKVNCLKKVNSEPKQPQLHEWLSRALRGVQCCESDFLLLAMSSGIIP